MNFCAVPAIDIRDGKCVRLMHGDYNQETIYSESPVSIAKNFVASGAKQIHIVDLDGAKAGMPVNSAIISDIIASCVKANPAIKIEVGGGIRNEDAIKQIIATGATSVILGTSVINKPEFLQKACQIAPGKIILGLDAKDGMLAVDGWTKITNIEAEDFAKKSIALGVSAIVYTDIRKDGSLEGPNIAKTARLAAALPCPVYASGGVSNIEQLKTLSKKNVSGAIIGRAIYTGAIKLEDLQSSGFFN